MDAPATPCTVSRWVESPACGAAVGPAGRLGARESGCFGERPCTDFSNAVCEPYDWLMHGTGKAWHGMASDVALWRLSARCTHGTASPWLSAMSGGSAALFSMA